MNKKKFSVTNIGSISLLMIFIILCMVTLAALSLSSAASEANTARKFADHNTKYYQADNQAEETLDIIDGILGRILHCFRRFCFLFYRGKYKARKIKYKYYSGYFHR